MGKGRRQDAVQKLLPGPLPKHSGPNTEVNRNESDPTSLPPRSVPTRMCPHIAPLPSSEFSPVARDAGMHALSTTQDRSTGLFVLALLGYMCIYSSLNRC